MGVVSGRNRRGSSGYLLTLRRTTQGESLMCQEVRIPLDVLNNADKIAGNSYLGGFAAGLHHSGGDPYEGTTFWAS